MAEARRGRYGLIQSFEEVDQSRIIDIAAVKARFETLSPYLDAHFADCVQPFQAMVSARFI
ncbi:hypothetical protein [Mesorhizobium sp. M1378]|uniref:hypothetical protein n=1 Tax=Mesorhizobium sp. M1378 TaxID=2957092 RepID=UPI00333CC338